MRPGKRQERTQQQRYSYLQYTFCQSLDFLYINDVIMNSLNRHFYSPEFIRNGTIKITGDFGLKKPNTSHSNLNNVHVHVYLRSINIELEINRIRRFSIVVIFSCCFLLNVQTLEAKFHSPTCRRLLVKSSMMMIYMRRIFSSL